MSEGFWAVHITCDSAGIWFFSRNRTGTFGFTIDRYARGLRPDDAAILGVEVTIDGSDTLDSALFDTGAGGVTVTASFMQASGGSAAWNVGSIAGGGADLDEDPLLLEPFDLVDAPNNDSDSHLWAGSRALDAFDLTRVTTSTDLDGEDRIQDGTVDPSGHSVASAFTA